MHRLEVLLEPQSEPQREHMGAVHAANVEFTDCIRESERNGLPVLVELGPEVG